MRKTIASIVAICAALTLSAGEVDLSGTWRLEGEDGFRNPLNCPIAVPGDVHSALLTAGIIEDTFYGTNEVRAAWINRRDWKISRTFRLTERELAAKAIILRLEDVDTFAKIRINGRAVGETSNRFRRWDFDVKPFLRSGENVIEGDFRCAWDMAKERATAFGRPVPLFDNGEVREVNFIRKPQCHGGWDWGITQMQAGFCGTVKLVASDDFRIDYVYSEQKFSGDYSRCDLRVFAEITAADGTKSVVTNDFAISNPRLWWPNGMGEQAFHEVTLNVRGRKIPKRIALRRIELVCEPSVDPVTGDEGSGMRFRVNGRDVFAKGANWIPCDAYANRQTEAKYRNLLASAAAANMNMIRVWGGGQYEKDCFYDICDELGLMVWQDFMFACANYPDGTFLDNVREETVHQIKRLRDHGSIALWCGDNECRAIYRCLETTKKDVPFYYGMYRARIDLLRRLVAEHDPARTFWPGSPCNGPEDDMTGNLLSGTGDIHYWGVWHGGAEFKAFGGVHPRFCSEFGFQSYPARETCLKFLGERDLRLDSPLFAHHQKSNGGNERIRNMMKKYFRDPKDFDSLLYLSQVQQAEAISTAVGTWRSEMPWCMGTLVWQLDDNWPVSSWSMIDYGGKWKHLMYHAKRFYAPVAIKPIIDPYSVKHYILSVVNETDHAITDTLVMERWLIDGKKPVDPATLWDGHVETKKVTVKAGTAKRFGRWWGNHGFTVFRFGGVKNYWMGCPYKDCELMPARVSFEGFEKLEGVEKFAVTVSTDYPAFFVWLEAKGIKGEFSDNSFLLLPGEPERIVFTPREPCTPERFREALSVTHLQESYGGAKTSEKKDATRDASGKALERLGLSL